MADIGRLGQAGCARGVKEERTLPDGWCSSLGGSQRLARYLRNFAVDPRQGEAPTVDPAAQVQRKPRPGSGESIKEIATDDNELRRDEIDRMRQRCAAEI